MFLGILYAGRIVYYKLFISGVGFNRGLVRSCQVSRGPTDQHETKGRECESTKKGDKGGEHNVNDVITLRTKDGVRIKNDVSVFFVSGQVWNGKPKPPQSTVDCGGFGLPYGAIPSCWSTGVGVGYWITSAGVGPALSLGTSPYLYICLASTPAPPGQWTSETRRIPAYTYWATLYRYVAILTLIQVYSPSYILKHFFKNLVDCGLFMIISKLFCVHKKWKYIILKP